MKKMFVALTVLASLAVATGCYANSVDDVVREGKHQNVNMAYMGMASYRDSMYRYNYQIQQVATDNNSSGPSWGLYDRARNLLNSVNNTKRNFNYDYGNDFTAYNNTLRRLFELEEIRIGAMVDGIYARLQGRDPMPYFRRGTSAAYEFDDVLARFERM